ncbi:putative quinol monooxygenase [Bacteroidota bacterium]
MAYLTIVAKIKAMEDVVEVVRNELLKLIEPTRKEKGCLDYILFQDNEDPSLFLFYENWETAEDLDRHMESEHFNACFDKIGNMISTEVHKATKL